MTTVRRKRVRPGVLSTSLPSIVFLTLLLGSGASPNYSTAPSTTIAPGDVGARNAQRLELDALEAPHQPCRPIGEDQPEGRTPTGVVMKVDGRTDYYRYHEAFPAPRAASIISACYGFTEHEMRQAREVGKSHGPCLSVETEDLPDAMPRGLVLFIQGQARYLPFDEAFSKVEGNPVALICYSLRSVQPPAQTNHPDAPWERSTAPNR